MIDPVSSPATDPREIVTTRVFAAPPPVVFAAFSNPHRLAQWWGPEGFSSTFQRFELRPGGRWHLVMHGPDGANYPNENEFTTVEPQHEIVFEHLDPAHRFRMTMTFEAHPEGARLTWRMLFESLEHLARIRDFLVQANEQNFDRLAAHLAATSGGTR